MGRPVKPIENPADVDRIRDMLADRPRDRLLFDVCTRTGLLLGEVLAWTKDRVAVVEVDQPLPGASSPEVVMTDLLHHSLHSYLNTVDLAGDDFIFKSRKGDRALDATSVSHLARKWFREAGLEGLTGVKSLRKTWAVHYAGNSGPGGESTGEAGPSFGRVETATLRDVVRTELLRAILSGRLAPGERLFIKRIAQEMKVSPMPVRDALARLEASGFVTWTRSRAYVVQALDWDRFREIARLRKILEPMAAETACRERPEETFRALTGIHTRLTGVVEASGREDIDLVMSLNKEFHFTLYRASKMPVLMEMISGLWDKVSPYLFLVARESKSYDLAGGGLRHHLRMMESVRRGDCRAVVKWVVTDIDYSASIARAEFIKGRG